MYPPELIAGLVLAAYACDEGADPLAQLHLGPLLERGVRARASEVGLDRAADHASRKRALERLAGDLPPRPLTRLPRHARVAALLAPMATREARQEAGALPMPRRGYRPAPGLVEALKRATLADERDALALEERRRMEAHPWRA